MSDCKYRKPWCERHSTATSAERRKDTYRTNFTTNSNTGRTPLMSFFCYFWGIVSCLLPNNIFTFAVANNYFHVKTNNTTFWDLGWHGETLPFCHITETFCHHWVSSRFVRWMYSTRMFWWYISPAILRRHVSCQFLSLRWNNVFVNWRPQTSAFIFRCWYPPSSVGIHRPVLEFTVQCWRSPSNIGIHRPVLAFTVQCWHSPSSVGIHRPVLAFTVYWWHSPSSVGIHRPVLAFNVQCWHSPYSVGIHHPVLAFPVQCWHSPFIIGTHRLLMAFTVHCWHSPSSVGIHHSVGSCFADWEYVPNTSCRYVAVF